MNTISIQRIEEAMPHAQLFRVVIEDDVSMTTHHVACTDDEHHQYARHNESAEDLVRRAVVFLLTKEPKEAILARFTLSDVEHYFPEFASS